MMINGIGVVWRGIKSDSGFWLGQSDVKAH